MSDGLTAFERRRAENAKANNEILNSISKTSAKVFATKPATKSTTSTRPKRVRSEPAKRESPIPTRRSARVAGIDSTAAHTKRELGDDNALRYGLGESAEQAHKAKKLRVSGDLSLSDMQVDGRWSAPSLRGLGIGAPVKVPVQPGVRTFVAGDNGDGEADVNKEIQALRTELAALQLYDKFAVKDLKLTKERIYAMAFHPTEDKPLVFAGDKEGRLGIFDASQEVAAVNDDDDDDDDEEADEAEPQIIGFKPHARTITSVLVLDADPASVYTASYDTTIRRLDIQAQKSVEVYAPADDTDADLALSCIDFADPHTVFFSTLGGALGRHDVRTKADDAVLWPALHDGHKIGGFSLCPDAPHLVATASLDRTLKIWDVRKIVPATGTPFLVGSDAARLSVSHAAWGPGGHLATTSYDDFVRVYDLSTTSSLRAGDTIDAFAPVKVPHNNQTGRWVTILKPQWQRAARGLPVFVLGNMNRFVDVFAADGTQVAQLDGDGITAVPAVAHMHPTQRWVAGGNASGKLTLWL